jgi:hypothetical protein
VIADLIRSEVEGLIDQGKWRRAVASETRGRTLLTAACDNWKLLERSR